MSLTSNNPLQRLEGRIAGGPVLASTHIFDGSMLGESAGYLRPLVAGDKFRGHALQEIDNSNGASGDLSCVHTQGKYRGVVPISGIAITDVKRRVYASDDGTYTFVANGNTYVGRVVRYDSAGYGEVEFDTVDEGDGLELEYANIADSASVGTSSVAEAAFDKSVTIPAAKLKVGDVIRIKGSIQHTGSNTGSTLTGKAYAGSQQLLSSGALTTAAAGDVINFIAEIIIRAIGASGAIVANYQVFSKLNATLALAAMGNLASATIDTTNGLAITASAQYGASSATNAAVLKHLVVEHLHAAAQ